MTELTRIRTEKDGTETLFHEAEYDGAYPYRIELACRNLDEVKRYARRGRLIGIRLEQAHVEERRRPQRNMVGQRHIHGL